MKSTFKQLAAAACLSVVSVAGHASPQPWGGSFALYDAYYGRIDGANDLTGTIDTAAGTWTVASPTPFMGITWTASGGTLYGPGTHVVNVNGDGLDAPGGDGNVTFTVGAGQLGGNVNITWNANVGIDVFQVWNISVVPGVGTFYTSTDGDGDGIPGMAIVDGPFVGISAVFDMAAPVPEASTSAMLLAGLGLVGGMAARRRRGA